MSGTKEGMPMYGGVYRAILPAGLLTIGTTRHTLSASRRWKLPAVLLVSLLVTGGLAADDRELDREFRIGIIGDQTFSLDIQQSYGVLQQGVQALSDQDLDVVLHVGDLIESAGSDAEVTALFQQAAGILDQLPVDWFVAAGDHDVNPPLFQQDSPDRSREQLFQQLYGARVPAVLDHPYYSFDVGEIHFVALYSHEVLHADPRFGNIFLTKISDEQLAWLAADLEAAEDAAAVIAFIHQPLWYHWSGWQRVHELLREFQVPAVISGHLHYDQDVGEIDGIRYLTVGATGGFTKQGSRDAGDVDHVSVLTVSSAHENDEDSDSDSDDSRGLSVDLRLISLSDSEALEVTPRLDMDQVQAVDVVFGEFFGFAQRNPVFLKDGALVGSCDSLAPATISISEIGNPTNRPLNVQIDFSSDPAGVVLTSAGFVPGECEQVVSDSECILARTSRIFFSNYSSVLVNTFGGPLWQATPGAGGPQPPAPGTVLSFDVRLAFEGEQGELFLTRRVSTTISACP